MDNKSKRNIRLAIEIPMALSWIGLVVASGIAQWSVVTIGVLTWAGAIALAHELRIFTAPFKIGTPIRLVIIVALITGGDLLVCWKTWPRVEISPQEAQFSGKESNDTYAFRLSNNTPYDEYSIEVIFTFSSMGNQFEFDMPDAKRIAVPAGDLVADSFLFNCLTWDNRSTAVLLIRELTPHQTRTITITQKNGGSLVVYSRVAYFTRLALPYEEPKPGATGTARLSNHFSGAECQTFEPIPLVSRRGDTNGY